MPSPNSQSRQQQGPAISSADGDIDFERLFESWLDGDDKAHFLPDDAQSEARLLRYARCLSRALQVSTHPSSGHKLLPRLQETGEVLRVRYSAISAVMADGKVDAAFKVAAECFSDNWHIVEDLLASVRHDVYRSELWDLRRITSGCLHRFPRVYALALVLVLAADGKLTVERILSFVRAYQEESPLMTAELWALRASLRLRLLEHLRQVAHRIRIVVEHHNTGDGIIAQLQDAASKPGVSAADIAQRLTAALSRDKLANRPVVVQVAQWLVQDEQQRPVYAQARAWLDDELEGCHHQKAAEVIRQEVASQEKKKERILNAVCSLRLMHDVSWTTQVLEAASSVEQKLRQDPARVYADMAPASRVAYREAVQRISKHSRLSETDIAGQALEKSNRAVKHSADSRQQHVGYWLLGPGLGQLEAAVSYRTPLHERCIRQIKKWRVPAYVGSALLLTCLATLPAVLEARSVDPSLWMTWRMLYLLLFIVPASEVALCFLNRTIAVMAASTLLPSMNTARGVANTALTIAAMCTRPSHVQQAAEMLKRLEVNYLANQDPNVVFALLVDPIDADSRSTAADEPLTSFINSQVAELNKRHPSADGCPHPRFLALHRHRLYSAKERRWIGWDREHGQIRELFAVLRGGGDTSYTRQLPADSGLRRVQYVVKLRCTTLLGRDVVRRLVGVICHPLNAPRFDEALGAVAEGFGSLMPGIVADLTADGQSRFAQLCYDPLTEAHEHSAARPLYQDPLADSERDAVEQGLYVVDAMLAADRSRRARTGPAVSCLQSCVSPAFISGLSFFENVQDWATYIRRQHGRHGALLPRLAYPLVPNQSEPGSNSIAALHLLNQLRRSLVASSQVGCLALAWTVLPGRVWVWTLLVLATFGFPAYSAFISALHNVHKTTSTGQQVTWRHLRALLWAAAWPRAMQLFVRLSFLMEEAARDLSAVVRVLCRPVISLHDPTVWIVDSELAGSRTEEQVHSKLKRAGPVVVMLLTTVILQSRPSSLLVALPFLLLWALSPCTDAYLKRPLPIAASLSSEQRDAFRSYARRTWHYFETFTTADNHYLTPDNVQEDPELVIARRSSPTNFGLQMLAAISACDLGFIGQWQCMETLQRTVASMLRLQRWHGHFYNWYDTQSAQPLSPHYVSTVDSGNLAGHLLVVQHFCLQSVPIKDAAQRARDGLADTLLELGKELHAAHDAASVTSFRQPLHELETAVSNLLRTLRGTDSSTQTVWKAALHSLSTELDSLSSRLNGVDEKDGASSADLSECKTWMELVRQQVRELQRDLALHGSAPAFEAGMAQVARDCEQLFHAMDFKPLYDAARLQFKTGYTLETDEYDSYHFDMLASESRLASFCAVAKGDVPQEHWYSLGRALTCTTGQRAALISWTASMFEYLMPLLVMRAYEDTLLSRTYAGVVARQAEYGRVHHVPWGVSEAGFCARDDKQLYQYGPFGVPGLGLKRGLNCDLVISPYSSMLAAMVDPAGAKDNLSRLQALHPTFSTFGFHESVDYTSKRLQPEQRCYVLRSYMVHHQAMGLTALNNAVNGFVMQQRFHSSPLVQATQVLLLDRVPINAVMSLPRADEVVLETIGGFSREHPDLPEPSKPTAVPSPHSQLRLTGNDNILVTGCGPSCRRCADMAEKRKRFPWT